mgnify:CR=1 FL=1
MIDIKTKIHDKFSIEFKIGFSGSSKLRENNFSINSWIFIPNGLDINSSTYNNDQFYKDVKSNIRLITPRYLLCDIVSNEAVPYNNIRNAFNKTASSPTETNVTDYIFQTKMFTTIFNSSLREETDCIINIKNKAEIIAKCTDYLKNVKDILSSYRKLREIIDVPSLTEDDKKEFSFADEYMSHNVDIQTIAIIKHLESLHDESFNHLIASMKKIVQDEKEYKISMGYYYSIDGDGGNNRELVAHHRLLKKHIESALYLKINTIQDGTVAKQVVFGVSAGIAMVITTLIALPFQKYLGNYPILIFIILVIAYMLKDRLKEIMRSLFAYQLKGRYFDNKTVISIKNSETGWEKEGMDFITADKTPQEVLNIRNRSHLDSNNGVSDEKIILYRKKVFIDNEILKSRYNYDFTGINDITRFHIFHFTQKMDNPQVTLDILNDDGEVHTNTTEKTYTLYIVMQFQYEEQQEYRGYKITMTRDGITEINYITLQTNKLQQNNINL